MAAPSPSTLEQIAQSNLLTLVARGALLVIAGGLSWAAGEIVALRRDVVTLGERQIAISDRVATAVSEDRRRIEALEGARERAAEANIQRTREIADMVGALRELNAVLRGVEQRMDLLRMERRGALMQEIPG